MIYWITTPTSFQVFFFLYSCCKREISILFLAIEEDNYLQWIIFQNFQNTRWSTILDTFTLERWYDWSRIKQTRMIAYFSQLHQHIDDRHEMSRLQSFFCPEKHVIQNELQEELFVIFFIHCYIRIVPFKHTRYCGKALFFPGDSLIKAVFSKVLFQLIWLWFWLIPILVTKQFEGQRPKILHRNFNRYMCYQSWGPAVNLHYWLVSWF